MTALIHDVHPNFGQAVDISKTIAQFSKTPFVAQNKPTRSTHHLAPAEPHTFLDNGSMQFIPPKTNNHVENMTLSTGHTTDGRLSCETARRHWNTCGRCRQREHVMALLEMVAYILTGVLLIMALQANKSL